MAYTLKQEYLPDSLAWNGSRGNYSRSGNHPVILGMHATGGSLASTLSWFRSPKSGVSSHYVIDKDGTVYQLLPESAVAYTMGRSRWGGRTNLNDESINIELVNADNYVDPYPKEQYNAAVALAQDIVRRHNITSENVVSHAQVAIPKGRKRDPAGFDMDRFKYDVFSAPYDFGRFGQPTDPDSPIGGAGSKPDAETPNETDSATPKAITFWDKILALFGGQQKSGGVVLALRHLLGIR